MVSGEHLVGPGTAKNDRHSDLASSFEQPTLGINCEASKRFILSFHELFPIGCQVGGFELQLVRNGGGCGVNYIDPFFFVTG